MRELIKQIACALCKALGGDTAKPGIEPSGLLGLNSMSSILLDKLEEMGDDKADIYLPDTHCKVYDKEEVKAFLGLDEIDSIPYVEEEHDCDDFAAELFGEFAGLVWTNLHALNWFVDTDGVFWFIEPQQDKISQVLENWQGYGIRFFIGR